MIEIKPIGRMNAVVQAPPSKAHTLRALFIAALAKGKSEIVNPLLADDQLIAIDALRLFGVNFSVQKDSVLVNGMSGKLHLPEKDVFVGDSGVTARFLPSFAALAPPGKIIITGSKRMGERPVKDLIDALAMLGVRIESVNNNGCFPLAVFSGTFKGGKTVLSGEISSQYFSSILLSAPYAKQDVAIDSIGPISSKPYIDVSIDLMRKFGVKAENKDYKRFFVKAGQRYKGKRYLVEGDYSNAAYFFAAAAVAKGTVKVKNLNPVSAQGDKIFVDLLAKMGCKVKKGKDSITVAGNELHGISADLNDFPDIVQPLAVVASFAKGKTVLRNIGHLRLKECDRLNATATELRRIGINAVVEKDDLIIEGGTPHGAEIETYNDHRMAMSFAIAGLAVKGIKIKNEECVGKSFPGFFKELQKLYARCSGLKIILIGYRGTGKNAVGKSLAEKIGFRFLDADKLIEEKAGMPIAEIFKRFGEQHFRDLETNAIKEICAKDNCVIATGGGAPVRKENAAAMRKNSIIVLLECSPQIIFKRIKGDASRPRLTELPNELKEIKFLLKQRNPIYHSLADFVTDAGKKSIEENVAEIIDFLRKKGLLGEAQ